MSFINVSPFPFLNQSSVHPDVLREIAKGKARFKKPQPVQVHSVTPYPFKNSKPEQTSFDLQAPRSYNIGALISQKIDWLEFTVKDVGPDRFIKKFLGLDPDLFADSDHGMQGYTDLLTYGFVKVLFSPAKPERGTKVILSGRGLDEVALDAVDIIRLALAAGCQTFARIDVAVDDRTGSNTIEAIYDDVMRGLDVHRFTRVERRQPLVCKTLEREGDSIYWGKPAGSRQVTIYDKELERLNKADEVTGEWLRIEARWKKKAALAAALELGEHGLGIAGALIRGIIDFRDDPENDQTDRRTPCAWWVKWLGDAEPIKTGIRKAVATIERKIMWLDKSCKKAIGQVVKLCGVDLLVDIINAGIEQTTPKEWIQLDPDKHRHGHAWKSDLLNNAGLPIPF